MDYRNAKAAVELFHKGGRAGIDELLKQPMLQSILLRMHRTQVGSEQATIDTVISEMKSRESD